MQSNQEFWGIKGTAYLISSLSSSYLCVFFWVRRTLAPVPWAFLSGAAVPSVPWPLYPGLLFQEGIYLVAHAYFFREDAIENHGKQDAGLVVLDEPVLRVIDAKYCA